MSEVITKIEELDYELEMIDISVNGDHLFFANDILTHNSNSDVDITDTSESFGLPATCDLMLAFIVTEELEKANQYLVKQLKNRYSDKAVHKRFIIGVDRPKMRLYDVSDSADDILNDSSSAPANNVASTPFSRGGANKQQRGKPNAYSDFKV